MTPKTLAQLAQVLGITLKGDDKPFTGFNTLEQACETDVSFLSNPRYSHLLQSSKAVAVFVDEAHKDLIPTALVSTNPYLDFARATSFFQPKTGDFTGISPQATIHPSATLAENCTVYPHVYISANAVIGAGTTLFPGVFIGNDVTIGNNCTLYPHTTVLARIRIGNNCVLQSGAVLGTDGFGFIRLNGTVQKIPQIGTVTLGDDVEIGANSCVDRATLHTTSVGNHTKLDNLVQLGHNVTVDESCFIIAQVGIAGSTKVGKRVTIAGQAGIAGHLTIGDDTTIGPLSGVAQDIAAGMRGAGIPFMPERNFLRSSLLYPKLPELNKRIKMLEKELQELKSLVAGKESKDI